MILCNAQNDHDKYFPILSRTYQTNKLNRLETIKIIKNIFEAIELVRIGWKSLGKSIRYSLFMKILSHFPGAMFGFLERG